VYPVAYDNEPAIELDGMEDLAAKYMALKDQIKSGEEALDAISNSMKEALGNHERGIAGRYEIKWPMRNYKAQPEKVTPAKPAYSIRQSNVTVKESKK
jgi:predicted phage-related endonuclease